MRLLYVAMTLPLRVNVRLGHCHQGGRVSAGINMVHALWRFHRLLANILVLEYAATFAIVLGAVSIVHERAQTFALDSGMHKHNLYVVQPQAALGDWLAACGLLLGGAPWWW